MEDIAAVAPFADWKARADPRCSGVCFSPADGGCLIAGNGRRLARVPLQLPVMSSFSCSRVLVFSCSLSPPGGVLPFTRSFVLPLGAVAVLQHPDFLGYENQLTLSRGGAEPRVMFRAWDHLLVTPVLAAGRLEDEPGCAGLVPLPASHGRWMRCGAGNCSIGCAPCAIPMPRSRSSGGPADACRSCKAAAAAGARA